MESLYEIVHLPKYVCTHFTSFNHIFCCETRNGKKYCIIRGLNREMQYFIPFLFFLIFFHLYRNLIKILIS